MKNLEKLYTVIRDPKKYGAKKGTRVYKAICSLVIDGVAKTGYSDMNTKYIITWDVKHILDLAKIPSRIWNDAPRGGANGEHVGLSARLMREACAAYQKFNREYKRKKVGAWSYEIEDAFIKSLQN